MKALIVDARFDSMRPAALKEQCASAGWAATTVALSTECHPLPDVDFVLVHVGEVQNESGDDIGALLTHYRDSTWTLCYSGGTPLPVAVQCTSPFVAVFPEPIDPDEPDASFLEAVRRVLKAAAESPAVLEGDFRTLVLGLDEVLEAKLEFLGWLVGGPDASKKSIDVLTAAYPADMASTTRPSDITTVRKLRDHFFGA